MWIGPNAGPVFFAFGVGGLIFCWMYWSDIKPVLARLFGPIINRYLTSSTGGAAVAHFGDEDRQNDEESAGKGNGENAGNSIAKPGNEEKDLFSFPDAFTVAALLIEHNKLSETDVLREVFGAKAGKKVNTRGELTRYGAAHAKLQIALANVRKPVGPQYRPLTPEQATARDELELARS